MNVQGYREDKRQESPGPEHAVPFRKAQGASLGQLTDRPVTRLLTIGFPTVYGVPSLPAYLPRYLPRYPTYLVHGYFANSGVGSRGVRVFHKLSETSASRDADGRNLAPLLPCIPCPNDPSPPHGTKYPMNHFWQPTEAEFYLPTIVCTDYPKPEVYKASRYAVVYR